MQKVSICIPIYNTEKYIEKCVISLFEQTYPYIEYIFIDDKSPDNSINIVKKLINTYHKEDKCIIISHDRNKGLAAARNSGVAASTGEFIMHVDSDDYLENNAVELVIKKQQEDDADIVSFGFITEYSQYKVESYPPLFKNGTDMCKQLIKREVNMNLWGRLYKTSLYKAHNISAKEGADMGEDYQVAPILAYYAKNVSSLQIALYHYNCLNPNSFCYSFSAKKQAQSEESTKILMDFFKNKPDFKEAVSIGWLNIHIAWAKKFTKTFSKENKERYRRNTQRIHQIDKTFWKKISFKNRVILITSSSYFIGYTYINTMRWLKKIYHMIGNAN